ncbi:hypothetical protein ACFQX6_34445 [Streptosporangium lutulentum]
MMVAGLPASRRLELYLLHHRMASELGEVRRFRRDEEVKVVRRGANRPGGTRPTRSSGTDRAAFPTISTTSPRS